MLLGITTQQKSSIPSFESIEFKFSENCISSRNNSIDFDHEYQPASLTYTDTQTELKESLQYIDLGQEDKENFDHIQVSVNNQKRRFFQAFRKNNHNQKPTKLMRRKKSIIFINNIELNLTQSTDRTQQDTKRSNNSINFKGIQRKNSFSRNRISSIQSSSNQSPSISDSIHMSKNSSIQKLQPSNMESPSIVKKRSISCMKTQDKSILSSVSRSCSRANLKRSESVRHSCNQQQNGRIKRAFSGRNIFSADAERPLRYGNVQEKVKNAKKRQFLQDTVPLQNFINVKTIKLEQNTLVSRAYLRKIIQNRVSIQHYAENQKNYHRMRR